ncbi:MAG: NF038122 family metalloprotease, partial [Bryobacteraceae bacterium]
HTTLASPDAEASEASEANVQAAEAEMENVAISVPKMAPTRSSFLAIWPAVNDATAYELDVSTDPAFRHCVGKYRQLNTGNARFRLVTGLEANTQYYYRVRIHDASGGSRYSETMTGETNSATSLVIDPSFDISVYNSPKSAAIQSTVMKAIADYATLFRDPISVTITFRYSSTQPDGAPLPAGIVSRSDWGFYNISWSTYLHALKVDALTQTDATANTALPATALAPAIATSSAGGRAIGLDTPPLLYGDGTVADGAPLDGIVTFNSSALIRFSRPPLAGYYDGLALCEHEIDEVLGLGSHLNLPPASSANLRPQDLFTWSAPHVRNTYATGVRYLAIDPGVTRIVDLNQTPPLDYGDWASMG